MGRPTLISTRILKGDLLFSFLLTQYAYDFQYQNLQFYFMLGCKCYASKDPNLHKK